MKTAPAVLALLLCAVVLGVSATLLVSATVTMAGTGQSGFSPAAEGTGAPSVSSLSAAAGPVGSSITIFGSNFSAVGSNNIVWFGSVRAPVIGASATRLVVLVPPGAGYAPVSVTKGGLTAYSAIPFAATFPSLGGLEPTSFTPTADIGFGTSLAATALADVDGDGRLDLVVANQGSGVVRVFHNQGMIGVLQSNSFAAPLAFSAGALPNSVVAVDIDGDGRLDVVTAGSSAPLLSVLRNTSAPGAISFAAAVTSPLDGTAHPGLAIADFDGDGRPDVATANSGTNTISVVQNLSSPGTVSLASAVTLPVGVTPIRLAAGDLDGDSHPDIVAASAAGARLTVIRNLGIAPVLTTNSFAPKFDLASLSAPYDVAVGDVDGDGRPDLAAAISQNLVSVWRNISAPGSLAPGSFAARVDFPVAASVSAAWFPWTVGIADLNGDAKPEIFTANYKTNFVSVLRNRATAGSLDTNSFAPWIGFSTAFGPFHVAAGDLDGDGRPDLVSATTPGNTVSLLRNIIPPVCEPPPVGLVGWWPGDANANDIVGTSHGALAGTSGFAAGKVGPAFECSGDDHYVVIANYPRPTSQFTYSAWVHARSTAAHAGILRNWGNAPEGQINLELSAGRRLSVTLKQADGSERLVEDSIQFPAGQWILVTAVADGSRLRLYRSGVEVGNTPYDGTLATSRSCLIIGADTGNDCGSALSSGTDFWDGQIDEVAIWNRGLTPFEIQQLAAAGSAGMCKPAPLIVGVLGGGGVMRSPMKSHYAWGESVTLTATNRPYYTFLRWSDGMTSASRVVGAGAINDLVAVFTNTVPLETLAFKQWDRSFGGVEFDSYPTVRRTPDGGYVLAGSTTSGADGNKTTPLCGITAAWIVKLDGEGNQQWEQTIGAPGDALYVVTLETTADGGYVLGASSAVGNTVVINNCGKASTNFGLADFWLVRLDSSGQRMWEASYGGDDVDALGAIAVLDDGGLVLVGTSSSGATGNKASPPRGNKDCWIVRVDANGNKLWDRSFGGNGNENGLAVAPLADGGFLVTGNSASGIEGTKTAPAHGLIDYWAVRLDAEGNQLWDRSYGGDSDDIGGWMAPMPGGGALLVGYSDSAISGTKTAANRGGADYWAVRIDANGQPLWDRSFGGLGVYDWAYSARGAADGGVMLAGESDTDVNGNKTTAQIGNSDGWLVRLNPYGEKAGELSLGGIEYDYLWSVDAAGQDAFILAGGSYSDVGGNKESPLWGNEDFWVVKIVERTAPVGMPVILVNGQFHAENHFIVTNSAAVSIQTSFANGHIFYTLNGALPGTGAVYTGPFAVQQSVTVRAIAYNADYSESAEAGPVTITVVTSPIITVTPPGQVAVEGSDITLAAEAVGTPPLTYAWLFNDALIDGALGSFLQIASVTMANAGNYRLVVSNPFGVVTSALATVTVLSRPAITAQPASTNVSVGESATFCVTAAGSPPLTYQWRLNGVNIPDATNACYTASVFFVPFAGLTNGGSYTVVVQNGVEAVTSDPAVLGIEVAAPVSADQFAQRSLFDGSAIRGTNRFATKEAGEPNHAGNPGGRSIWYQWTVTGSANYRLKTTGSTFDTLLAVYTGTNVANLTLVAEDDDSGGFHTSSVQFYATAGQTYVIAVDGFAGDEGEFVLSSVLLQGTIRGAEILQQPVGLTVSPGANASFSVAAINASSYEWYLNGVAVPNSNNPTLNVTNVQAAQVGSYHVVVRGHPSTAPATSVPAVLEIGPFATLRSVDRVEELLTSFGNLRAIQPASGSSSVSIGSLGTQILNTTNSTTSFRETNHCGIIGGSSRWFRLQAATNATFAMDTEGSDFNTVLAVYTASAQSAGYPARLVACNDDAATGVIWSRVTFKATNGIDYLIVVDGVGGASGPVTLNWWLGNPPVIGPNPPPLQTPLAREGTNLTLVTALTNGIPPPQLQWYRNQTLLGDATNASLLLNNMQLVNAGTYSVVARNALGAITSIVARVTVDVPLNLGVITITEDGRTHVRVSGVANQGFVIQGTTNFANWIPLYTNPLAAQPVYFDDRTATNRVRRFYRAQPWP